MAKQGKWKISVWHNQGDNISVPMELSCGSNKYKLVVTNKKTEFLSDTTTDLGSRPSKWSFARGSDKPPVVVPLVTCGNKTYSALTIGEAVPYFEKNEDKYEWKDTSEYGGNYDLDMLLHYGRVIAPERLIINGDVANVKIAVYTQTDRVVLGSIETRINSYETHCERYFNVNCEGGRMFFICRTAQGFNPLKCNLRIADAEYHDITNRFTRYKYYGIAEPQWNSSWGYLWLENEGSNLPNGNYRVFTVSNDNEHWYENDYTWDDKIIPGGDIPSGGGSDIPSGGEGEFVYTVEAEVNPSYVQDVREDVNVDYTFTASLFKTNTVTGEKIPSNDWEKYGIGPSKYCNPKSFSTSSGKKQIKLYDNDNEAYTATITDTTDLKYTDKTNPYCLVGIVNGDIVASEPFSVNYCNKYKKFSATIYLFREENISFNPETNTLTFVTSKGRSYADKGNIICDGETHEIEWNLSQTVGGSFGAAAGTYYVVYGSIYSVNMAIQRTIKVYRQGSRLPMNVDTHTPWKYDDVRNNIYVTENMGSYRKTLGDTIFISAPFSVGNGTLKLTITYTVDTPNLKGTCEQE